MTTSVWRHCPYGFASHYDGPQLYETCCFNCFNK